MKVLAICGSRNRDGETAKAAGALLDGVRSEGGEGEIVFTTEMHIERCRQCRGDGWGTCLTEGRCIQGDDDFAGLVQRVREADAVVFASPVYFSDLSETLRTFLERLRRICITEAGRPSISGKPAIAICLAGGSGGGAVPCSHAIETMMLQCGFYVADVIPVRRQNISLKHKVLTETGKWLQTGQGA